MLRSGAEVGFGNFEQIIRRGLADYARSVVVAGGGIAGLELLQGERVVRGQRIMQAASDPFLGWATGTGARERQFYVRQLRDMKGSAVIEGMPPARLARYGEICGVALAYAHARSGDAAKIAGYLVDDDTFDRALDRFAVAYADQNDADYAQFTAAADEQRIAIRRGV